MSCDLYPGRMRRRGVRAALIVVSAAAFLSSGANAGSPLPTLLTADFATTFAIRPALITPSGDGSTIIGGQAAWVGRNPDPHKPSSQLGHIDWTSWTASNAAGSGVYWSDNGVPDEADGTYFPHDVRIVASDARGDHFTRLLLTFSDGRSTAFTLKHLAKGYGVGYIWN